MNLTRTSGLSMQVDISVYSVSLISLFQLTAHAHHTITANEAQFKNMDDINQEFAKTFYPGFTRFGEFVILPHIVIHPDVRYI
jgi:hypothetical protein